MAVADPDKYIVFKRDDFDRVMADVKDPVHQRWLKSLALDDAVVVRRQDVFAAAAFYSYASAVQSVIDIIEAGTWIDKLDLDLDDMRSLADYFMSQAHIANELRSKVPD